MAVNNKFINPYRGVLGKILVGLFSFSILVMITACLYFGFTAQGGLRLVMWSGKQYLHLKEVSAGGVHGNLMQGLVMDDFYAQSAANSPVQFSARIERISLQWLRESLISFKANVKSGFIDFPNSKPIGIEGEYDGKNIQLSLRSEMIDSKNLLPLLPLTNVILQEGKIVDLDMAVSGDIRNPSYDGKFQFNDMQSSGLISIRNIKFTRVSGVLREYVKIEDLAVNGVKQLPDGSVLLVQEVKVNYKDYLERGVDLTVRNARLKLNRSNVIVMTGGYSQGKADFNIYSTAINIKEIISILPGVKLSGEWDGSMTGCDIYARGPLNDLVINGGFRVDQFSYAQYVLEESLARIDMRFNPRGNLGTIFGVAKLESGIFRTPKTDIEILPSQFAFSGDVQNPSLNIQAVTEVDKTRINIKISGTKDKPELVLESSPSRSREVLMIMIATGKDWKRTAKALDQRAFSQDVVKDFVEYLLFAGKGSKLAQQIGLESLTIHVDENSKGLGFGKKISDQLSVNYDVQKQQAKPGDIPNIKQKIGTEVKVTDNIAIEASKSVNKSVDQSPLKDQTGPSGQADIKLKYQSRW